MSTPRVHYIGLDTPVSPGARGLISKEICAQSAAVQKRSAIFCHPSLIPVQSYLADLWYLQHIGTPEVPGGVVNFSSPPTTLLRHKEQPAPSHPPPSLLRWLRHPSAVRRPSHRTPRTLPPNGLSSPVNGLPTDSPQGQVRPQRGQRYLSLAAPGDASGVAP